MTSQQLPASLAAATVSLGLRVLARLLQSLIPSVLVLAALPQLIASRATDPMQSPVYVAGVVTAAIISVINVVLLLASSRTFGSALLGYEYRCATTGQRKGGRALGRALLTDLFVVATLGIGAIVIFATYRDGTTLVDRWLKMVAVKPKAIDPARDVAPSIPRPPATVRQVTMPGVAAPPPNPVAPPTNPVAPPLNPAAPAPGVPGMNSPGWQANPAPASGGVFVGPGMGWGGSAVAAQQPEPSPMATPAPPTTGGVIDSVPNFGPRNTPPTPMAPASSGSPVAPQSPAYPQPGGPVVAPLGEPARVTAPTTAMQTPATVPGPHPQQPTDETVLDSSVYPDTVPRIRLDDGQVISLETPVVFGRNPVAPEEYPNAQPKALLDETMKLSKTHAVVFADNCEVKVLDVGSRNGVVLEQDGVKSKIPPGEPFVVPGGATIHTGGRNFRVTS